LLVGVVVRVGTCVGAGSSVGVGVGSGVGVGIGVGIDVGISVGVRVRAIPLLRWSVNVRSIQDTAYRSRIRQMSILTSLSRLPCVLQNVLHELMRSPITLVAVEDRESVLCLSMFNDKVRYSTISTVKHTAFVTRALSEEETSSQTATLKRSPRAERVSRRILVYRKRCHQLPQEKTRLRTHANSPVQRIIWAVLVACLGKEIHVLLESAGVERFWARDN
jgi:hypothetical protein